MSVSRESIVAAARAYVGAPWRHQGRNAISGIDCAGLIVAVGGDVDALPADLPLPDYARVPNGSIMQQICNRYLVRTYDIKAGSVLLFRIKAEPQHLAIATSPTTMIHALMDHSTLEQTIDANWLKRIIACYDFPTVTERGS